MKHYAGNPCVNLKAIGVDSRGTFFEDEAKHSWIAILDGSIGYQIYRRSLFQFLILLIHPRRRRYPYERDPMSTVEIIEDPPHPAPLPRSASQPKPKGILKNAAPPQSAAQQQHSLQWDEANLALTEIQKDSLMKITEPKTPYVRYNAETDEVEGDIPDFQLGARAGSPSSFGSRAESPTSMIASGPSSRRASLSSAGRNSSGRSGSATSSRSTSFNLPNEARGDIRAIKAEPGDEIETDEELDEEAAAKHAAFVRARLQHYSNEAEAMKKAPKLMDEEDVDQTGTGAGGGNGNAGVNNLAGDLDQSQASERVPYRGELVNGDAHGE